MLIGLGLGHGLALLAVSLSGLWVWTILLLTLVVGSSWSFHYSRQGLERGPWFVGRLRWLDEHWEIRSNVAGWQSAPLAASFCHRRLILIDFRVDRWHRRTVVIPVDACRGDGHRHLRLLLNTTIRGPMRREAMR